MANPALAPGALAKPSRLDRDVAKHQRRVERSKQQRAKNDMGRREWDKLRWAIFVRDGGICRSCGRGVKRQCSNPMHRAETHHIVYRSAGGPNTSPNLATLCGLCHSREHAHYLEISGNGDGVMTMTERNIETGKITRQWDSLCPSLAVPVRQEHGQ